MSYMYNLLCVLFDSYVICKEISQKRELKMWLYVLSSILKLADLFINAETKSLGQKFRNFDSFDRQNKFKVVEPR